MASSSEITAKPEEAAERYAHLVDIVGSSRFHEITGNPKAVDAVLVALETTIGCLSYKIRMELRDAYLAQKQRDGQLPTINPDMVAALRDAESFSPQECQFLFADSMSLRADLNVALQPGVDQDEKKVDTLNAVADAIKTLQQALDECFPYYVDGFSAREANKLMQIVHLLEGDARTQFVAALLKRARSKFNKANTVGKRVKGRQSIIAKQKIRAIADMEMLGCTDAAASHAEKLLQSTDLKRLLELLLEEKNPPESLLAQKISLPIRRRKQKS